MSRFRVFSGPGTLLPPDALGLDLAEWWRAADHGTSRMTVETGERVTAWKGRIQGLSVLATTLSSARPTWTANGVNFDGVANTMTGTSLGTLPVGSAPSMIVVVARPAVTGSRVYAAYGSATAYRRILMSSAKLQVGDGTTTALSLTNIVAGTLNMVAGLFGSTIAVRLNGLTEASGAETPGTGTDRIRIGASAAASAGNFFSGDILEVFILRNPTINKLRLIEMWAQSVYPTLVLPSGPAYSSTLAGDPKAKAALTQTAIPAKGNAVVQTNTLTTPVARIAPFQLNPAVRYAVDFNVYRASVTTVASADFNYGFSWLDAAFAEISQTIIATDRDFIAGDTTQMRSILSASADGIADVVWPANAVWCAPFVLAAGTSNHVTDTFSIRQQMQLKNRVPSPLDGLPFLKFSPATFKVIDGYNGRSIRLQRYDGQEQDWYLGANGRLDISSIRAWAGTVYRIYATDAYDQKTGRRNADRDDLLPTLEFVGPGVPAISSTSRALSFGTGSGSSGAVSRATSALSLILNRMSASPRHNGVQNALLLGRSGSGARAAIYFTAGVPLPGRSAASGRHLDADDLITTTGLDELDQTWRLQANSFDETNNAVTIRLDARKVVDAFGTSGLDTSDTSSSITQVGGHRGSWNLAAASRALLTDDQMTTLLARLPDMASVTDDTYCFDPFNLSWYTWPFAQLKNGVAYYGFCDRNGRQYVASKPGRITLVSDVYYQQTLQSDHLAPPPCFLADDRFFTAYTGHGWDAVMRYRLSTDGNPANMAAEVVLPQGTGTAEYANVRQYLNTLAIFSQEGNSYWGVHVCADTTTPTLTFATFKRVLVGTISPSPRACYIMAGQPSATEMRIFCYDTPAVAANSVYLMQADLSTGAFTADGVALGNWNDAGGPLPASMYALPKIYTVPATDAIRLLNVKEDGSAYLYLQFNRSNPAAGATYRLARLTGVNPYIEASWTHTDITIAGTPYDVEDVRWGGACFANEAHSGIRLYLVQESGGIHTLYRYDSADDGATWTATTKLVRDVLTNPVSPVNADATCAVNVLEIYDNQGLSNSGRRAHLVT